MPNNTLTLEERRERIKKTMTHYPPQVEGFGRAILERLRFTNLQLSKARDGRDMAETTHEIEVGSDMLNGKVGSALIFGVPRLHRSG